MNAQKVLKALPNTYSLKSQPGNRGSYSHIDSETGKSEAHAEVLYYIQREEVLNDFEQALINSEFFKRMMAKYYESLDLYWRSGSKAFMEKLEEELIKLQKQDTINN